ncbi:hypothetical protein PENSPDRAFT_668680 [Peniophora sp. CONT]|nr:hypothetical protein PENSPDRAFT_668680 [Peniophora sp. CONT]
MQYFAISIARGDNQQSDSLFAGFRHDKRFVAKLAAVLSPVTSPYAAVGFLRFLQLFIQADNPYDRLTQIAVREERRWRRTGPIIRAFRRFAEGVGKANEDALLHGDTSVMEAVSSFRLTLLESLSRTRRTVEDPSARSRILELLQALDRVESLRLQPLFADDSVTAEELEELFRGNGHDVAVRLVCRNALTLVVAAKDCGWRGSWYNPDKRYIPKSTPGTLQWFALRVNLRLYDKPPASGFFCALLRELGLDDWQQPGSDLRAPPGSPLPRAAVDALRSLVLAVNVEEPSHQSAITEERSVEERSVEERDTPLLSTSPVSLVDALSSRSYDAMLGNAEEGKAGSERHVVRATSMRSPKELTSRHRRLREDAKE